MLNDWRHTFGAFRHPNYRLWFFGQVVSLFGSWMQMTAQAFLIYQLTDSPAYLGLLGFANGLPTWVFSLFAGVIADRMSRRTLLVMTQTAMMILAFILAMLTFTGAVQPWHVMMLAFGLGVANAFDAPTRQAFVLELVDRKDMVNAIAFNSTMFNLATAVGPAASGLVYAAYGPAWCFMINSLTYLAVITALLLMRLAPRSPPPRRVSPLADFMEGARYVAGHSVVRTLIALVAVGSLFGLAFITILPAWAVEILGGDELVNGYLQSARGIGAAFSGLLLAYMSHRQGKGRLLTFGTFAFPLLLLGFSFTRRLDASLALIAGTGAAMLLVFNLANAMIQSLIPDQLRGRVMSFYTMIFMGMYPLGALWIGAAAERFGEPVPLVVGAGVSLVMAFLLWFLAPTVRRLE